MIRPMKAAILLASLSLAACVSAPLPPPAPTTATAAIGQLVRVGPLGVTPVAIVEDSRCPAQVQCVWAGRLRLRANVFNAAALDRLGPNTLAMPAAQVMELTLGQPTNAFGHRLLLAAAIPEPIAGQPIPPAAYRFTFTAR